ncbi:MAG: helix-hairpin-helix domain-containing protein [Thermoplasmata archaeon]
MKAHIDYRESEFSLKLGKIFENISLENLDISDICMEFDEYCIIIERKEYTDYINSVKNGHLWDQLARMYAFNTIFKKPIKRKVLIINNYNSEAEGLQSASIAGSFLEVRYVYNIDLFVTLSDNAFIELIRIFKDREESGKNDKAPVQKWEHSLKKSMDERDWKIYVLSSLPYVGTETATKLLDHFKSIENISKASVIDLKKVKGIGTNKARKIYEILH